MITPICTPEWLTPESIDYIVETLMFCENPQMLADLREIFPASALREAAKKLPDTKKKQTRAWVESSNRREEVAA